MQKDPQAHSAREPLFAKVALPIPLDKTFTYEIPSSLRSGAFVGRRVEVPFGKRVLSGVIVDLCPKTEVANVKPINSFYDTYLPPPLLVISEWISSYYGCSPGETMHSVLPPGLKKARVRRRHEGTVVLNASIRKALEDENSSSSTPLQAAEKQLSRAKKQLWLFRSLVSAGGAAPVDTLASEWGVARPVLDGLIQKGIAAVKSSSRVSPLDTLEEKVTSLTPAQTAALEKIKTGLDSRGFFPALLYGVTGSGKTEVYLRAAKYVLAAGGGCIVLVPEIGLLPQATARYRKLLGNDVAIIHSRMTGAERYDIWEKIVNGICRVVVGPRSAIFSPVKDLRLIVVDEEQDDSYKQDEKPRYHARNVALMRGKHEGLTVVLGSATPSLETLRQSQDGHYEALRLPARAVGAAMPDVHLVDMRSDALGSGLFSKTLADAVAQNLAGGGQTIIFLNKRGHARFVQCKACGWVAACENCDISLTFHRVDNKLRCHFCGFSKPAVSRCETCGRPKLFFSGVGTQRVELDLQSLFPGVNILRMDADTTSGKEGHRRILEEFSTGRYPILLGTQMVAKGHHFPGVNLVGVLHAEEGLNFPDFRSAERTYRQLTQVAGRCGRGNEPGRVIIQTFIPDHYVYRYLRKHDYDGFMAEELSIRRQLNYPPFTRIILASCGARDRHELSAFMAEWAAKIRAFLPADRAAVLGPAPPLVARVKNRYREQILVKGRLDRGQKDAILGLFERVARRRKAARTVDLRWDVDPESFF